MPAVTVDDVTKLVRIEEPSRRDDDDEVVERPIVSVTDAPSGYEGLGFPVRRAFAGVPLAMLDPFIHMDQMGEVNYAPGEPKGTSWHPHRGFETVTYMIDGTFQHQDSTGGGGLITDGATQWMTAGAGILHIETPPAELVASGGLFHGLQLWVNLPAHDKWVPPRYQDITAGRVSLVASHDAGAIVRVIAGSVAGVDGPGVTYTPITAVHATVQPGHRLTLPWQPEHNALAYVLSGAGVAGGAGSKESGAPVKTGSLVVYGSGDTVTIAGRDGDEPLDVVLLGGRPIGEPVAAYGPFVMNTRAELEQAFRDYEAGKLGTIPAGAIGT
ncbi:MAG TPA: pirin family protein [Acidimicrobiales bacterium]|nr:pirin family protein [Acidimicrobiales bacterium]